MTTSLEEARPWIAEPNMSIEDRMRALWVARQWSGTDAIKFLESGLIHDSVLIRHEIAYVMGQLGSDEALPILNKLLDDPKEHVMVRHEAAEAMGAIGSKDSLPYVDKYLGKDTVAPLRETCQLAHDSIVAKQKPTSDKENPPYVLRHYIYNMVDTDGKACFTPIDPVVLDGTERSKAIEKLGKALMDPALSITARYEAMFALRNAHNDPKKDPKGKAWEYLTKSMREDTTSALFRHEVAFVLGQMQDARAAPALIECVADYTEHCMVRHEAALALGSVATSTTMSKELLKRAALVLKKNATCPEAVVGESCTVALDNMYCP